MNALVWKTFGENSVDCSNQLLDGVDLALFSNWRDLSGLCLSQLLDLF